MKEEIKKILDKLYLEFEKAGLTASEYSDLRGCIINLQEENELLTNARYSLDRVELERRIDKALAKINNMFDLGNEDTIIDDLLQLESILKGDKDE